ncbi:MAG: RtcB family protein [Snodgrassella sp.]|uniref:RtcB family protein n=1 Tax=Snodgrassella sp. TaxID=2815304 RepID=UPI002589EFA7|nr:RtcB family protein [Snodgrassella sp.]MCO6521604.1 RtcB family protein [Snodgrassella sp.]
MHKYEVLKENKTRPVKMWTKGVPVEDVAKAQLLQTAELPFIFKHIAVMPDVHLGRGSTVGSVIPTTGAVIPAAVGVDIGCGMMAVQLSLTAQDLPEDLMPLRRAIEKAVPHGSTPGNKKYDKGSWHNPPPIVQEYWQQLLPGFEKLTSKYPRFLKANSLHHLGTLGSGNHFIEVCLDETDQVWIMLHSGSRGIGHAIGKYFSELAQKEMKKYFIDTYLPNNDLAYFAEGTEYCRDYLQAVHWAQDFARVNREVMMHNTIAALRQVIDVPFTTHLQTINCHHNYVQKEQHFGKNVFVTRKGAVSAREGELGIIPGSMGAKSYIVRGLGNTESFHSCSHGAGRVMSRAEAKRRFTVADQMQATAHVECRKDAEVIDEIPLAYKDIDAVMQAQQELVEIRHQLRQVICVKG